uniref:Uncharacterized protein n=1 Tax=Polytomella parva TaxID=51329 RepID=A0A7S0Y9S9_9CHLO|mmetsp:Transcript_16707/g.30260  ORF Transcript_16707/g.30260 Transcript_16707/m.30260 type:complete len:213 (+) Transcript_16707:632-1270(+)
MGEETEDKAGISESVKSESQISNSGSSNSSNSNGNNNHSNNHSNSIAVPSTSNRVDNGDGLATSDQRIVAIDKEGKEASIFPHKPTSNGGAFPDPKLNPKSSAKESEMDPALRDDKEGFPPRKESMEDLPKKKEGGGGIALTPFPGLASGNAEGLTNGTSSQQQNATAVAVVAAAAASATGELGNLKTNVLMPSAGGLMASHVVTTAVMVPI